MARRSMLWAMGLFAIVAGILGYTMYQTNMAHTTFERYYAFRGCSGLLDKTDTYGDCKLANGQEIKMVLYKGGWYLDGDLPMTWGNLTL